MPIRSYSAAVAQFVEIAARVHGTPCCRSTTSAAHASPAAATTAHRARTATIAAQSVVPMINGA